MGYSKGSPSLPKDIIAHLSDRAGVMLDGGRRHDLIEAERLGVEFHRPLQVGNGDADMAEAHGSRHDTSSSFISAGKEAQEFRPPHIDADRDNDDRADND